VLALLQQKHLPLWRLRRVTFQNFNNKSIKGIVCIIEIKLSLPNPDIKTSLMCESSRRLDIYSLKHMRTLKKTPLEEPYSKDLDSCTPLNTCAHRKKKTPREEPYSKDLDSSHHIR
jgi:hypothetical protein